MELSTGSGPGKIHKEKAGLGDISISPVIGGWEYDTAIGHVNHYARLPINLPTGSFRPTDLVNLGRNYAAYSKATACSRPKIPTLDFSLRTLSTKPTRPPGITQAKNST